MKTNALTFFIILFIILLLVSCKQSGERQTLHEEDHDIHQENTVELTQKQMQALNLKLGTIEKRNVSTAVKINGELAVSPSHSANISAVIGGNIKEIKVFDGDKVKKGQVLVLLEHPDYIKIQEDFAVIAPRLEYLKKDYERQKELYDKNAVSEKNFQKARSEYFTAKAHYEGLKSRLKLLHLSPGKIKKGIISNTIALISPIEGYVNQINIKVGTYVDAEDVILEITDNKRIHADFTVFEKDVPLVKNGEKIHFTVSNHPDKEYTAKVFAIGREFDRNSRSITVHAKVEGQKEGLLPGMYITGHLHSGEKYVETLPNEAIATEGDKHYIFISDTKKSAENEKTKFKMLEVMPGRTDNGYTEVRLMENMPENAVIVLNAAYYLLAEKGKDELGDDD